MPNGFSLHVGLNRVNTERYPDGRYPRLFGCDLAAAAMAGIAKGKGFSVTPMWDPANPQDINLESVRTWFIETAETKAMPGDLVLFTFAGHGDRVRDTDHDEAGDQALVLYDRLLIDDEIYKLLKRFKPDVRVVVVADCCYGGSVIQVVRRLDPGQTMPEDRGPAFARPKVDAEPLLLSASKDTTRADGATSGGLPPFTKSLLEVLNTVPLPQGYVSLKTEIKKTVADAELFDRLLKVPANANRPPFEI
jgi:hypothetical protein